MLIKDCLRSYESLRGFRLYIDGHVEDLKYHDLSANQAGYCYFQFKVKPTERSKTEDGKDFYWGLSYLKIAEGFTRLIVLAKAGKCLCLFYKIKELLLSSPFNIIESFV